MSGDVLVAGVGNIFLGDDGFGPEVARRLVAEADALPNGVRVVDYGIRGVHLAYDLLAGVGTLVLVDALPGDNPAGTVSVLAVEDGDLPGIDPTAGHEAGLDAHDLHPAAVLAGVLRLGGALPRTYVVGAQPASLEEGIVLSGPMTAAVDEGVAAVHRLLSDVAVTDEAQPCA